MKISQDKAAEKLSIRTAESEEDELNMDDEDAEDNEDPETARETDRQRNAGDGYQDAPWIERLDGSKGRGIGSRVWRVRRDLGRVGDGGD